MKNRGLMERKWVVFDFCETLVNIQSADAFVDFSVLNSPVSWKRYWRFLIGVFKKVRIFSLADRFFPEYGMEKRMRLFLLRGISEEALERLSQGFVVEVLKKHEHRSMVELLEKHLAEGDWVQLSSGGLRLYLKHWAELYGLEVVDATDMEFKDGVCTGFIEGKDCMHGRKVELLGRRKSELKELQGCSTVAYSDSISDLPLLLWADEAWVISYEKKRKWPGEFRLKEWVINRDDGRLAV
jgi:HAD superfamily hydrolase (TIGR01490 family)